MSRQEKGPRRLLAVCIYLISLSSRAATIVDTRAISDEKQSANWLSVGRTYSENHYSPLASINLGNIKQLGLAWYLDLPNQGPLQATPLAADGVLYFSGANARTYAVDARTGRELWEFDPDLAHHLDMKNALFGANRGVAFWKGRVYVGTVDGRLVALDAKTGHTVWSVQTFEGSPPRHHAISGAPRVFNDKVIIGHGWESVRGYVTAYDTENGKQLWRFYTVPGDLGKGFENAAMAMAAKTWRGEWWHEGGGGAAWDSITYDSELNRIYIGTGNVWPSEAQVRSPGEDDLFAASIVALDADTGEYLWHYQVNPGEAWDYDATQQLVLADLTLDGKTHKVLMQADKNGFFYVLDRMTGKLISAEKIGKATWAERIDLKTGRPVENPGVRYRDAPVVVWPSAYGVHNWQAMSFNPSTGLVYIPTMKLGMRLGPTGPDFNPREPDDGTGNLLAWDPITQRQRWEVHYADSFWNGGTLSTAGDLVFHGTGRGWFIAYDAHTGQQLWRFYAGLGINAAPMTYAISGVQYVSVLVGYGGTASGSKVFDAGWHFNEQTRRLLTFALGKQTPLPLGQPPRFKVNAVDDPAFVLDAKQAAGGAGVYNSNCALCHGVNLENFGSFAPDLRESALAMNWEAFRSVLHEGSLAGLGMPRFADLTDEEMRSIFMYIRKCSREATLSSKTQPDR